jgi:hemolysin activation/secretion protein
MAAWLCGTAPAQEGAATRPADHGRPYPVTELKLRYSTEIQGQPSIDELLRAPIELGKTAGGYVSPKTPGVEKETRSFAEWSSAEPRVLYGSAVGAVSEQVLAAVARSGLIGVFVSPSPTDISEPGGEDRRGQRRDLTWVIYTGRAKELRTIASGNRISKTADRINAPQHKRIMELSPVQPGELLNRREIDDYALRLTRHPGRRVDVAVATTTEPEMVTLDYLVAENRPWQVYFQLSNTGTDQTDEWRQRFGFMHTQLTGRDDILILDYTTTGFQDSHAVAASYEAPVWNTNRVRWKVFGRYSEFTASELGLAFGEEFEGEDYALGGELIANVWQRGSLFLDLFGGLEYQHPEVSSSEGEGEGSFIQPYIGARLERFTDTTATDVEVKLTFAFGDADEEDLDLLGRLEADEDWVLLSWQASHSFYIEPTLFPERFKAGGSTLANEIHLALRGQYAFDYRLIPHAEETLGGLFTVRGYEESILASDTAIIATAEYRLHVPRLFKVVEQPGKFLGEDFRFAPIRRYGRTDWDLILRGFVDVGWAIFSDEIAPEENETLAGAGVGIELQFKQNVSIRLDWGFVLEEVEVPGERVDSGDSRLHVIATFVF